MAENDDENLIGYDPLAWMQEQTPNQTTTAVTAESAESVGISSVPNADASLDSIDNPADDLANRIVLEATQSIQNVQALHELLLQAFNLADSIEIDASAVQQIDASTLQLLLIAKQSGINLQKRITIDFPSERFIEAAELLGLAEMLEVDQAAAGFF